MRSAILDRLRAVMAAEGLDAVIAVSPENFTWATGFVVPSQALMRWRHAMAVVTPETAAIVCVDMEESTVRQRAGDTEIRVWREFGDNPMAVLAALLGDLGLASARIGTEFDYLPAGAFADIAARMTTATMVPAEALFDRLRQNKTEDEIALLRRLSRVADRAIGDAFAAVRAGMTEMDLAAALVRGVYEQGGEQIRIMIVATGERSQLPNVGPTDRVLQPGDVCRVEVFPVIGGYNAGVCRTAIVQHPPPEAERIWANLVDCRRMLLETIRPGARTRPIYQAFLDRFGALGLPPIAFVGHGIGLHLHEAPYLAAHDDSVLEAGMVLGVEPLVYNTGLGFGLQLKDMVAVTNDCCELLSDVNANDELIVIG